MDNTSEQVIKELAPYILLQPYRCSMTIGKDIVKSLGYPTHVCLRINDANKSFAIIPCEADDVMSFKVPEKLFTDHHCVFRLHSKEFIYNLVSKYDLNPKCVYACKGIYYKNINAIIVKLDNENISIKNTFDEEKTD